MRHVHLLGVNEPMIYKLLPSLQKEMGDAYPELYKAEALIKDTIKTEEERFIKTMEKGLKLLDDETKEMKSGDVLDGKVAFKLYDTYGFPLDLTQDALKLRDISVDENAFNDAMAAQKAEARKNWAGSGDAGTEKVWFELQEKFGSTEFLGYNSLSADGQVKALVQDGKVVTEISSGEFSLLANQTPFYAEMGGQVGDIGLIKNNNFMAEVVDTKKKCEGLHVHICRLVSGVVKVEDSASFEVDVINRSSIQGNHTVTHLLHKALQEKYGSSVTQKGSYVAADRMRFDIAYNKQITSGELRQLEDRVNEMIQSNFEVNTKLMSQEDAVNSGAMALFGEKYGDEVRVVCIGDGVSTELCGGTHVRNTGNIGGFNILSDSAIAAGVRRLECVTGNGSAKHTRDLEDKVRNISQMLKVGVNEVEERVAHLLAERKEMEAKIFELKKQLVSGSKSSDNDIEEINGVKFISKIINDIQAKELKAIVDDLKNKYKDNLIVSLFAINEGKSSVVIGVSDDIKDKISAVELVKKIAPYVGAQGGGGRPDMAQTGGNDTSHFEEAIMEIKKSI